MLIITNDSFTVHLTRSKISRNIECGFKQQEIQLFLHGDLDNYWDENNEVLKTDTN